MQALIAFLDSFSNFIIALGVAVNTIIALAALRETKKVKALGIKTHDATNSKIDLLLEIQGDAREAKGLKQGREEIQTERKE